MADAIEEAERVTADAAAPAPMVLINSLLVFIFLILFNLAVTEDDQNEFDD
jgi:hypothetical protein